MRRRRLRHHLQGASVAAAVALAALPAMPAAAQTLGVRSGEHRDFTRLVIRLPEGQAWVLGRTDDGYGLRLPGSGLDFDVSRVFPRIPRSRVAEVRPAPDGYDIVVTCDCRAVAFEDGTGLLVVDVRNGAPEPGARAETPLPPALLGPATAEADEAPASGAMTLPFGPSGGRFAAPRMVPAPAPRVPPPLAPGFGVPAPRTFLPGGAPPTALPDWTQRFVDAATPDAPAPAAQGAMAADGVPVGPGPAGFVADFALDLLARQFARAAAQGLVAEGLLRSDRPPAAPQAAPSPAVADDTAAAADAARLPSAIPDPLRNLRIEAETARDRLLREAIGSTVLDDGATCLPDRLVALADWGDGRAASEQIAARRAGLVGEFDRPDPEAVLALAQLYLHLGFGAEVLDLLAGFPVEPEAAAVLRDLAVVIDEGGGHPAARFAGMEGCASDVALWAVLAAPTLRPETAVDRAAVLRAFSALPLPLRRHLGPGLVERFLAARDDATAEALRAAVGRAPGDHGIGLDLIDAGIALSQGAPARARAAVATAAAANAPGSAEALALYVEARLAAGEALDTATADHVVALAFELRGTPLGARLSRLEALGLAATQRFDAAFAVRDRLAASAEPLAVAALTEELVELLASAAPDDAFLVRMLREDGWRAGSYAPALRLALGERFLATGFPEAALAALPPEARSNGSERLIRARASLALGEHGAALRALAGQDGAEAARLRGAVLSAMGEHRAARAAFLAAGDLEAAARAAWLAGEPEAVAALGGLAPAADPAPLRPATGDAAPEPEADAPEAAPAGALSAAEALLGQSLATRQRVEALLEAAPSPREP